MEHLTTKKAVYLILACLFLVGCAQRETSIGIQATGPHSDVEFDAVPVTCAQDTVWRPPVSNGYGLSLQWGRAGNFGAVCLLRFEPSSVLPDSFRVDSNRLVLRGVATLPAGTEEQEYASIRLITDPWAEDSVRVDNMPSYEDYPFILDRLPMSAGATDSFEARLPDTLVAKWIEGDTLNWGIWIQQAQTPVPEDTARFLREFYSGESGIGYGPALYLYGVRYDTNDQGEWEESPLDTFVTPQDDAYLAWDWQPPIEGRMALTQGVSQRLLLYFPLEDALPQYGASVVHAELTLWTDNLSEANFGDITLLKHGTLKTKSWQTDPDSTVTDQISVISSAFDINNEKVVFDVTLLVSDWVQDPETNCGFFIVSSAEAQALGRRIFYNRLASDTTVVPELRIWYATIQ
ncbi:MAG: DNRLRE domain-containing protein [bacterium]